MPHPIVYVGIQDDDQTRAIDVVHIEPSIREGVHLVSSLYGPEASSPLYRYPPANTFPPYLTGDPQIPSILTCNTGQWDASPASTFAFQWMADGADIPGANGQTWESEVAYDGAEITCEVRGENYLGEAYAITSNSIPISLIEPIELGEMEDYVVTGVSANKHQTMQDERTIITTGMAAENRIDIARSVAYFSSGMSAYSRNDINTQAISVVTGLPQPDTLAVLERDYGIAVISQNIGVPLVDSVYQTLDLKNPEAELGLFGWDVFGAVTTISDIQHTGQFSWFGGEDVDSENLNMPYSYIYQDVPIFADHESDVDAGSVELGVAWYQESYAQEDQGNIRFEFYAENDDLLGIDSGPGLLATPGRIMFRRYYTVPIPALTRYIRIFIEFNLQEGVDNNAIIDSVQMQVWKGTEPRDRFYGPEFEQWRLRFIQSNTWSGGALSELEFREIPGGVDLCDAPVGNPIFGSAGFGVTNADAAFDNVRDTNYWAGEENGIAAGTSWIGYNMATPVQPEAIEITARQGSNALQVPRSYFVEGSDDGIRWTPVHYVDQDMAGGDYNTGERREIIIPKGSFDFYRNHPDLGTPVYNRSSGSNDDYPGKGNLYYCHSRIDITHISAHIRNQMIAFDYLLQFARVNTQKNGNYGMGMITEVLEEHSFTSASGTTAPGWVDQVLDNTYSFEVGEYFMIRFFDLDAATNPDDENEGRLSFIDTWDGPDQHTLRKVARCVDSWNGFTAPLELGQTNPSGNNQNYQWGLDFKGNVF